MQFEMVLLAEHQTDMVPLVFVLLTAYLIAKLLYQLVTGKALSIFFNGTRLYELLSRKASSGGTVWSVRCTRDEQPARYWAYIGIDFVTVIILFFMTRCLFTHACDSFIWSW